MLAMSCNLRMHSENQLLHKFDISNRNNAEHVNYITNDIICKLNHKKGNLIKGFGLLRLQRLLYSVLRNSVPE